MPKSGLTVFNTLTKRLEDFSPINDKQVNMFVCGQTVYDDAHLGHAKTYITFAVISRWLRHQGYNVKYVQNITDIDDKIITRARDRGVTPKELADYYEKRLLEDMQTLGIKKDVDVYPRSHDYIETIREQIQLLLDKGYAYVIEGDVYYNVAKFEDYTKLSRMKIEELTQHRIEVREGKINVYDFSLWKTAKEGEPSWKITVKHNGKELALNGRPGWHIEDTAMTYAIFGSQYDVHGGANELIFPHHTNEIAQAEAAFGVKPFVKYWLHSGVLNIKKEKMSKILRNFITIREFLKMYEPETLKLLVCSTHYRKDIDYTDTLAKESEKKLRYLYSALSVFYNTRDENKSEDSPSVSEIVKNLKDGFEEAMNNDFNTPLALANLTKAINSLRIFAETHETIEKSTKDKAMSTVLELAGIFGILESNKYKEEIPRDAMELIKMRESLRKDRKFGEADAIRNELKEKYRINIDDTDYGTVWYS